MTQTLNSTHYLDVYAEPGAPGIIDAIDPDTGLTAVLGETEEQVRARYPHAVRMSFDAWQDAVSAEQRSPIAWLESTEEKYAEMLNILPPAMYIGHAFMVGEADDHDVLTGKPRFAAYRKMAGGYFVASRPMTKQELLAELKMGN